MACLVQTEALLCMFCSGISNIKNERVIKVISPKNKEKLVPRFSAGALFLKVQGYAATIRAFSGTSIESADAATYASLLRRCADSKSLLEGRRLHSHIIKCGCHREPFIRNLLLQMYSKCGSLEDAVDVFERIVPRNVFSWNIMVAAYAQNGHIQDARSMFHKMPQWSVVSWNAMITAYAQHGHLEDARDLFDIMPEWNMISWNCIVTAYAQNGYLEDARSLFNIMPERNVIACTAMITAYSQAGHLHQAHNIFDIMSTRNAVSWNAMLQAYAHTGYVEGAKNIFDKMPHRDVVSWTAMIAAYNRNGELENAHKTFKEIPQQDIVSWTSMIAAYAQNGHLGAARSMFNEMHTRDVVAWNAMIQAYAQNGHLDEAGSMFNAMSQRNVSSWNGMIQAYAQNGYYRDTRRLFDAVPQHSVPSCTAMIQAYAQRGLLEDARTIFDGMPWWDVFSWTAVIAAYAQSGHGDTALELFRRMDMEGVRPNDMTYLSVIDACNEIGSMKIGKAVHASIAGEQIDVMVENSLITLYGTCGGVDEARNVFAAMLRRNVISWSAMIGAYAHNGHAKDAIQLFQTMVQDGVKPSEITLVSILSACSHAGLFSDGRQYFVSMDTDFGIIPTGNHYECIVDLLGRVGQLDKAEELAKMMPFEPNPITWKKVLSACKTQNDVERGAQVAKRAFELDPEMAAPYILLSNMHAATGNEDGVAEVRKAMQELGIKKQVGCSLI